MERIMMINDSFQNWKGYQLPKAQLILTDIPYQLGANAYGSNPMWYNGGDNANGESKLAKKSFFDTDTKAGFRIAEFFHFCSKLLKKEPKEKGQAGAMILFCAYEQQPELIKYAKEYGFNHYQNLMFYKNYSPQVLKANMKIVGNTEYALVFYRDKLPKFRNGGRMIFNCRPWISDSNDIPKIHPTQKPIKLLESLIEIYTDIDDVVIDCCAGSGTTLVASGNLGRKAYGFEIKKEFCKRFETEMKPLIQEDLFIIEERKEKDEEKERKIEMLF